MLYILGYVICAICAWLVLRRDWYMTMRKYESSSGSWKTDFPYGLAASIAVFGPLGLAAACLIWGQNHREYV